MSIDAKVDQVQVSEDGSGVLHLVDRPARRGGVPGIRGQSRLTFKTSPAEVEKLKGKLIWGNDQIIMLADSTIASRTTYTSIRFVPDDKFEEALDNYESKK